jgi:hypothetical protein
VEKIGEIAELAILPTAGHAVEKQQARGVAVFQRPLRDPLRREIVIEFAEIHSCGFRARPGMLARGAQLC